MGISVAPHLQEAGHHTVVGEADKEKFRQDKR